MTFGTAASASPFGSTPDVAPGAFVATDAARDDWRAAPVPRDWVLEGAPLARYIPLARGRDDLASTTLWDCTAGTFRWHFVWDETVHILDGAVEVTLPTGEIHRLTAGSVAFFPAGSTAVWKVEGHVRKLAICRRAFPAPLARAIDLARRAKHGLARLRAGARAPGVVAGLRPRAAAAALVILGIGLELIIDIV